MNVFAYDNASDQLKPTYNQPEQQYDFYSPGYSADGTADESQWFRPFGFQRCPGTASQPAEDGSTPFNEGFSPPDDCDPSAVIPEDSVTAP